MLAMAADLHDRMACTCGCGQWRKDAHDPDKKDRWQVDWETCYVRRAINDEVKATEPPEDAVMQVRLLPEGVTSAQDDYADLLARFPHLRQSQDEPYKPANGGHEGSEDDKQH